ncbi:MAG TPA: N-acetylmuramoyl-L-alanine amidase, partial [Thermoleophilia bacterium]|nr:N-acetylmuramoyl-L-alanine amidase [Thermoleophilia bacterium]
MRRKLSTSIALIAGVLVMIWAVPAVSDADSGWLKEQPVRGCVVDVENLDPGSASPGVKAPSDGPPPELGGPVQAQTVVVDPGLEFNLVGAVGRRDQASGQGDPQVAFRTSSDGETWSDWMIMSLAPAPGDVSAQELMAEPFWVGHGRYMQFTTSGPVRDLKLSFVNSLGENTVADRITGVFKTVGATIARIGHTGSAVAQTSKPAIVTRSKWGADESLRRADPDFAPVKMAFVHHTVSGNNYSRSEAPAVVRAIYYYHVRGVGFNDLGYNFLIDRYGTIYEGRYGGVTAGVIGAQTFGFNTGSTGVALMGSFDSSSPPAASLAALKKLLAWKLDVHHVKPTSSARMTCRADEKYKAGQTVVLPAISGHRNANYTACPGAALYAKLPGIRISAANIGLPKIYSPTTSAALISPDGDGHEDATTIRFSASEKVNWQMRIAASDGTLVRSFSGLGTAPARVWNGKDGSGAVVPDGSYTVKVTANSSRGTARAALLDVAVDTEPPRIEDLV